MSARFLFAAWPFQGHLFPQIALAHALRERGHECAFYTGTRSAATVRAEGFHCFPFAALDEAAIDRLMQSRPAEPWRVGNLRAVGRLMDRWLIQTLPQQAIDLEAAIASWRPDAIGSDPTMWAPMLILAEKHSLPVAVCSFIPACPLSGPGAPPFGPGLRLPVTLRDHIAIGISRRTGRLLSGVARREVNRIRRRHGLPPMTTSPTDHTGRVPLYLVPCTRAFDYGRTDVPDSVNYVGPYLWNRPRTEAPTPWLAELARQRPCVHVTEGTMHIHTPVLLKAALQGLADEPIRVVATTGGRRTIEGVDPARVAGNIRVEPWVSHSELLPYLDAVVTTGGAGSVLASLAAGVPLVIVPTEWDKPEIAQRVVHAGAGLSIPPGECSPGRVREAVWTVLKTPSFRDNARRLGDEFARAGGRDRAADLLVALAGR